MRTTLLAVAVFVTAAHAGAQTATPTRTPTRTPTHPFTPTNAPTPTPGPLPFWIVDTDIGAVGVVGSANWTMPTFFVKGSGTDIGGTADAFHYMFNGMSGDGDESGRIYSVQVTDPYARAGVMFRETLDPDSKYVALLITTYFPGNGIFFQRRFTTGGDTLSTPVGSQTPPYWLKIQRVGNTFTASIGPDPFNWTVVGSDTIAMASDIYGGMAVTSHNNGVLCEAIIDNFGVDGGGPDPTQTPTGGPTSTPVPTVTWTPTFAPTVTPTPMQTPGPVVLSLSPASGPASGGTPFTVSGTAFQQNATLTVGGAAAQDVSVVNSERIDASAPALSPGSLNDVVVGNPTFVPGAPWSSNGLPRSWLADFLDVLQADLFHPSIEKLVRHGITAGCGNGNYCRDSAVTRAQAAVFLLKAEHGSSYVPPACTGIFADVACLPTPAFAADWIEQLFHEGTTGGCGGGNFCPDESVTRAQMAVFLLKAVHGPDYAPSACIGIFEDVACSPNPAFAADWIENLYLAGVTGGCGASPRIYCPDSLVTRGQMAALIDRAFALP